jgi:hypothetical protein
MRDLLFNIIDKYILPSWKPLNAMFTTMSKSQSEEKSLKPLAFYPYEMIRFAIVDHRIGINLSKFVCFYNIRDQINLVTTSLIQEYR